MDLAFGSQEWSWTAMNREGGDCYLHSPLHTRIATLSPVVDRIFEQAHCSLIRDQL